MFAPLLSQSTRNASSCCEVCCETPPTIAIGTTSHCKQQTTFDVVLPCVGYNYYLQYSLDNVVWVDYSVISSNCDTIFTRGEIDVGRDNLIPIRFRIIAKKKGCPDLISNTVLVNYIRGCECHELEDWFATPQSNGDIRIQTFGSTNCPAPYSLQYFNFGTMMWVEITSEAFWFIDEIWTPTFLDDHYYFRICSLPGECDCCSELRLVEVNRCCPTAPVVASVTQIENTSWYVELDNFDCPGVTYSVQIREQSDPDDSYFVTLGNFTYPNPIFNFTVPLGDYYIRIVAKGTDCVISYSANFAFTYGITDCCSTPPVIGASVFNNSAIKVELLSGISCIGVKYCLKVKLSTDVSYPLTCEYVFTSSNLTYLYTPALFNTNYDFKVEVQELSFPCTSVDSNVVTEQIPCQTDIYQDGNPFTFVITDPTPYDSLGLPENHTMEFIVVVPSCCASDTFEFTTNDDPNININIISYPVTPGTNVLIFDVTLTAGAPGSYTANIGVYLGGCGINFGTIAYEYTVV